MNLTAFLSNRQLLVNVCVRDRLRDSYVSHIHSTHLVSVDSDFNRLLRHFSF